MTWIRIRLSRLTCFWLGHLMIAPSAANPMVRGFLAARTESICLRCMRQESPMADIADNFFAATPLQRKLKGDSNV